MGKTAPFVSEKGFHGEAEKLIGWAPTWREIRIPHSKRSIWKQMEMMTIQDDSVETIDFHVDVGGREVKRVRLEDEVLSDVLVECLNSGDEGGSTYLGKLAQKDDGWKEKEDEVLLKGLFG